MLKNAVLEADYRLAKWIIRNLEKEQLLSHSEVKTVWEGLLSLLSPPNKSLEAVGGSIRSTHQDESHDIVPFRRKTLCGNCGNFFAVQTWHNEDRVLKCWGRCQNEQFCSTKVHIYEYAFAFLITQFMLSLVSKRKGVIETCEKAVSLGVADKRRRSKALDYVRGITTVPPDRLEIGQEPAHIIEQITVFPDRCMKAEIIDGTKVSYKLKHYSPKQGW